MARSSNESISRRPIAQPLNHPKVRLQIMWFLESLSKILDLDKREELVSLKLILSVIKLH